MAREAKEDEPTLTPRQRFFVLEYLKDRNATQAYIRAGYAAEDADVSGPRLLGDAGVAREIAAGLARMALKVETKAEDVLKALVELSEVDIADAYDDQGMLLPLREMPVSVRKAIAGVETSELWGADGDGGRAVVGEIRKVKFIERTKALEMLAKFHKLLIDRLEVKVDGSFADMLKKARTRAKR